MASLALPPLHGQGFYGLALGALVATLNAPPRVLPGRAYAFFLGWFLSSLYWVAWAPATFNPDLTPLAPLAPVALALWCALFPTLGTLLARAMPTPAQRLALLPFTLFLSEACRGLTIVGFPWNTPAHILGHPIAMQGASLIGAEGLSLMVLITGLWLWAPVFMPRAPRAPRLSARWAMLCCACAIPLGLWAWGEHRLNLPTEPATLAVRLVQPNIPQREKWHPQRLPQHLQTLSTLSAHPTPAPDLIVWPETALPPLRAPANLKDLPQSATLLTGLPWYDKAWHNGLFAIHPHLGITARYAKHQLVPFGEFIPLAQSLPWVPIAFQQGYAPGPPSRPIAIPAIQGLQILPLICFEVVFPHLVRQGIQDAPFMVNITNDAWYGHTAGPHQHRAIARWRSIETGRALVRVANTGISEAFDGRGRSLGRMGLGTQGVLDVLMPTTTPPPTPFLQGGWLVPYLWALLMLVGGLAALAFQRLRHQRTALLQPQKRKE